MLGVAAALFVASPIASAGASTGAGANDKPEAIATLKIENPKVDVKKKGADDFKPATDGQDLHVGDTVRTDATGLAEIDYDADTYTRLDVSTTFKIVKLTDDQGNRQVEGTIEGGQTWNRTTALTESEKFDQTGAGATAAITGTAYAAQCNADATHCDWIGVVDAFTLTGKDGVQKLVSPLDQCDSTTGVLCADITHLDPSQLGDWIVANLFKDVARGFPLPAFLQNATIVFDQGTGEVFLVPAQTAPPVIDTANPVSVDPACDTNATSTAATPASSITTEDEFCVFFTVNATGADSVSIAGLPTNGLICAPYGGAVDGTTDCLYGPGSVLAGYARIVAAASAAATSAVFTTNTQFAPTTVFAFAPEDFESPTPSDSTTTVAATNAGGTTTQDVPTQVTEDDG